MANLSKAACRLSILHLFREAEYCHLWTYTLRPADAVAFTPVFQGAIPRVRTFRKDLVRAGVAFEDEQGRRADFHSLRMTFGTNLTVSGASPRVVMELMRHSDIKLTMKIYTDPAQLRLSEAVLKLSSVCPLYPSRIAPRATA